MTNRRIGAWCGLLAIALQILLSFGHAHRIGLPARGPLPLEAVIAAPQDGKVQDGKVQTAGRGERVLHRAALEVAEPAVAPGLAFEYCAVCALLIEMNASAADAPASTVPTAAARVRFAPRAEAAASASARLLFEARAPPRLA